MNAIKACWLGSLALGLAMLTAPAGALDQGGPSGADRAAQSNDQAAQPTTADAAVDADRRPAGPDVPSFDHDYRHHSLDQDADRVHLRLQQRHRDASRRSPDQAARGHRKSSPPANSLLRSGNHAY